MSSDSTDAERSTLQRKARAELTTIAAALGHDVPARAKKADIVDLIVGAPSAGASANGSATSGQANGSPGADKANGDGGAAPRGSRSAKPKASADAGSSDSTRADQSASKPPSGDGAGSSQTNSTDTSEATADGKAETNAGDNPRSGARNGGGRRNADAAGADAGSGDAAQAASESDRPTGGAATSGDVSGESPANSGGGDNRDGGRNQRNDEDGNNRRNRRRRRGRDRDGQPNEPQPEVEPVDVEGYLDLRDEGYGFLRVKGYTPSRNDVYVPAKIVRQHGMRKGDHIKGAYRPQMRNEKNAALMRVDQVAGMEPDEAKARPRFEDLTPLFPDVKLRLERPDHPQNMTARIIDLIAPVGKGQRGLIVSPPKAGKTTIMKTMAQCIEMNNPDVHLMVLLVDERPEEVTDMRRSVRGEVIGSTFDRPADEHTHVAEVTIERAKRLVELGKDVVIILDGITRLARAYNLAAPATGRIMSGGIDTGALYPPKKFFGAARNVEEGGSLTILATALVDTGSAMDNVIFEEFKGTGNMELRLDRRASEKRIFPAIDVESSSTRHEELLFDRGQLNTIWKLRRVLHGVSSEGTPSAALELLIDRVRSFPTNELFLAEIAKAPSGV